MKIKQDNAFLVMAKRGGLRFPFTICDLFWRSLWGTTITAFLYTILAGIGAIFIGPWLMALFYLVTTGTWYFVESMKPLLILMVSAALTSCAMYSTDYIENHNLFKVVREAYRARNEKFCSYVEVDYE